MVRRLLVFSLTWCLGSLSCLAIASQALAQSQVLRSCQSLGVGKYTVLVNQSNSTIQIPSYLAVSAVQCSYLGQNMVFFGNFNTIDTALFRVDQLRQVALSGFVQSFSNPSFNTEVPARLQGVAVIVEPASDINLTFQQVKSLTSFPTQVGTFNNRTVVIAASLVSMPIANSLVAKLQNSGLRATYVDPRFLQLSSSLSPALGIDSNSLPIPIDSNLFHVLVPQTNANTLTQIKNIFPTAFIRSFQGRNYIQIASSKDQQAAMQIRDRLYSQYPNAIVVLE